jgi:hypothetical protein
MLTLASAAAPTLPGQVDDVTMAAKSSGSPSLMNTIALRRSGTVLSHCITDFIDSSAIRSFQPPTIEGALKYSVRRATRVPGPAVPEAELRDGPQQLARSLVNSRDTCMRPPVVAIATRSWPSCGARRIPAPVDEQ